MTLFINDLLSVGYYDDSVHKGAKARIPGSQNLSPDYSRSGTFAAT